MRRRFFLAGMAGTTLTGFANKALSSEMSAKEAGYKMPEEAEPHERTFMQWPVSRQVYYDRYYLDEVQQVIAGIANSISEFEPVVMLMDEKHAARARRKLGSGVEIWDIPTEDLWCRDAGPVFVKNESGGIAISHMNFNGWGNKQYHANDGRVAKRVSERLGVPFFDNGLVGEGGGVESDGHGTLIAHASSWVNRNRNRGTHSQIGEKLLQALGADKIIWAPGIKGEDITDYHIDALARFAFRGTIVIQLPERVFPGDIWSAAAYETHDILAAATDASGRRLKIEIIPEPTNPRKKSLDFVASYVNYYVCNGAVIASQFGDAQTDAAARDILSGLYPDREIVMLNTDALGELGGGIHCATQQQPVSV